MSPALCGAETWSVRSAERRVNVLDEALEEVC